MYIWKAINKLLLFADGNGTVDPDFVSNFNQKIKEEVIEEDIDSITSEPENEPDENETLSIFDRTYSSENDPVFDETTNLENETSDICQEIVNDPICDETTNLENEASAICQEIVNSIIDRATSEENKRSEETNIRFSQESGYCEDFFSEDLNDNTQTNMEAELANISDIGTNLGGRSERILSPCFDFPATPAHSDDSGRYSAAAFHSDVEGEGPSTRPIHNDSGVEMSHHSDDEDDACSGIMPFKNVDPSSLGFYKKKCESLLEVCDFLLFFISHLCLFYKVQPGDLVNYNRHEVAKN